MKHREHLEELVKERTNELRMANEQLQEEMTARKRAERAVQEAREYAESIVETGNWESKLYFILSQFCHALPRVLTPKVTPLPYSNNITYQFNSSQFEFELFL